MVLIRYQLATSILGPATRLPRFGSDGDPPPTSTYGGDSGASEPIREARIAYAITVAGDGEYHGLKRLLKYLYHPDNLYYIHVDSKATAMTRLQIEHLLKETWVKRPRTGAQVGLPSNLVMVGNPVSVAWGGLSLLLTSVYLMAVAVDSGERWDYWVNVSPSDMPMLPQSEIMELLAEPARRGMSFISGQRVKWTNSTEQYDRREAIYDDAQMYQYDRREAIYDDAQMYQRTNSMEQDDCREAMYDDAQMYQWTNSTEQYDRREAMYDNAQMYQIPTEPVRKNKRGHYPTMVEYIVKSNDNTARLLLAYLASALVPDELFFGTLTCHKQRRREGLVVSSQQPSTISRAPPSATRSSCKPFDFNSLIAVASPLAQVRYAHWPGGRVPHPTVLDEKLVGPATESGCLFGRKFRVARPGQGAFRVARPGQGMVRSIIWLDKYLKDTSKTKRRMARARALLDFAPGDTPYKPRFCDEEPQSL
ncbi:core-2/I-branching enzyme-domain-containing protein [Tribonema minus]|uniref:protein xylosyltransferase n=1 Tax=Tribonema minus TaxID=303371 RepID=A0A835Z5M7_9STRA|nr:core-2/I-branching enzyme-domain-containing protein [Tribonema minus]